MTKKYKGNLFNSVRLKSIKTLILEIITAVLSVFLSGFLLYKGLYLIFFLTFVVEIFLNRYLIKKYRILKAGSRGELMVRNLLKKFPGKYKVFSDLEIEHNGRHAQIDNIIFAPNVIFVLEVKNYSGNLYGNENMRELTKVSYYGDEKVKKTVYNPFFQVRTHADVLRQLLRDNQIYAIVDSGVIFTGNNFNIKFELENENAFFYDRNAKKEIIDKLKSYSRKYKYDKKTAIKVTLKK